MSNLALALKRNGMYKESVQVDSEIIDRDPKFDKSYARVIDSLITLNDLTLANRFHNDVHSIFFMRFS